MIVSFPSKQSATEFAEQNGLTAHVAAVPVARGRPRRVDRQINRMGDLNGHHSTHNHNRTSGLHSFAAICHKFAFTGGQALDRGVNACR